jgi:hypothetical protein
LISKLLSSAWLPRLLWLAIAAQLLLGFLVSRPWTGGDTPYYLELAQGLANGHYAAQTAAGGLEPDALRPPGYPLLLWLLHHLLGLPLAAVVALQVGMVALSIYLVQRLLQRIGASPVPFLFLCAAYPFPVLYGAQLMGEAPAMLAVTALAVLLAGPTTWSRLAAAGLIAGIGALIRSDLALLPIAIAVIVIVQGLLARERLVPLLPRALLPGVVAALVLAPYALWNGATFGKVTPLPLAGAVGNSLYLAYWQNRLPQADLNALYRGEATPAAIQSGLASEVSALNRRIGAPPLTAPWNPITFPDRATQIASTKVYRDAAIARFSAEPAAYAAHVLANIWRLWNMSEYPPALPSPARLLLALLSGLATILGGVGVLIGLIRARGWPLPLAPTLILLYLPGLHLWLHTEARYTAPARLLLLLHAALLLAWAVRWWRGRRAA